MRSQLVRNFNSPKSNDKTCLVASNKSLLQDLRGQYLKLLIGVSVVSLSCLALLSNSTQKAEKSNSRQLFSNLKLVSQAILNTKTPQNEPASLENNRPLDATLQIIKGLSFAQCRILSSDFNGWVVDDSEEGFFSDSYKTLFKNFDFLNRQSNIILDERFIEHCPIRPRSSNAPPIA